MMRFRFAALYLCSPFARVANKINWRIGRPYRGKHGSKRLVNDDLIPGMVVLSHKDYELTNWFISGYWTHVAVVSADGNIIQAVSRGVIKTGTDEFFSSVDDFILLEPAFCCRNTMLRAAEYMERYLGYPYNFTFLFNEKSVTCIDLVCRTYSLDMGKMKQLSPVNNIFLRFFTSEVVMPECLLNIEKGWNIVHTSEVVEKNAC